MVKSTRFESVLTARYPPYNDDKGLVLNMLTFPMPNGFGAKIKYVLRACAASFRVLFGKEPTA